MRLFNVFFGLPSLFLLICLGLATGCGQGANEDDIDAVFDPALYRKSVFSVEGMTCDSCFRKVKALIKGIEGVSRAKVDSLNARVVVIHQSKLDPQTLIRAIHEKSSKFKLRLMQE
jgi:copper chaperone CopZ